MIQSFLWIAAVLPLQASTTTVDDQTTGDEARGQQQTVLTDETPELTFEFTPGVWLMRLRGDASNGPGNAPDLRLDTQLGLTDLVPAFRGEAIIARGDWSVRIAGSTFNTSGSTTAEEVSRWGSVLLTPGLDFTSSFDMSYVAAEVRWRAWNPLGKETLTKEHPVRLGVGPNAGVSWLDIDQSLSTFNQTVSNGHAWWTVWGGVNMDFEFDMSRFVSWMDSIRVHALVGVGGTPADGGLMWQAGGGAQFFFTPNIAASIGYRYEKYTLEDGDWKVNPNFQGLFIGGTIRF
ncbi:MAG: hypothetical protein CMJ29_00160 [Phycisphaerae bacterium]|nr:hypothetical protein [Phycisphaerae bacterium]